MLEFAVAELVGGAVVAEQAGGDGSGVDAS